MTYSPRDIIRHPIKCWPAVLVLVLSLAFFISLVACGADTQKQCRQEARQVFAQVLSEQITQEQGQARVDKACADVDAQDRQAIIDSERDAAIARYSK